MALGYYGGGIPVSGFDKNKCCDNLVYYHSDYCCERHDEIIGRTYDNRIAIGVELYCAAYKENGNCYIEVRNKVAKEQAEKEAQEQRAREEKIRQEKAEIKQRYEQQIRSNPDDLEIYKLRGYEYVSKGFYDLAVADFTTMLQKNPKDAETHQTLGSVYSQMGEYDNAIKSYNEAIRINPKEAEAYAFRGAMYSQKGEYNQALTDFNKALQLNPKCKNALVFRGSMYFMNGVQNKENAKYDQSIIDIDMAIADGEEALRLVPGDFSATDLLQKLKNEKEVVNRMLEEKEKKRKEKNKERKIIALRIIVPVVFTLVLLPYSKDTEDLVAVLIFFLLPFLLLFLIPSGLDGFLRLFSFLRLAALVFGGIVCVACIFGDMDPIPKLLVVTSSLLILGSCIWAYIKPLYDEIS